MVRTHWGAVTTPHLFVLIFIDTVAAADDNNSNNKYDEG